MPESKPTHAEPKAAAKAAPSLGNAGESSDAGVQNLLAQREAARLNDDQDAVKEIDKQLADLGFSAG